MRVIKISAEMMNDKKVEIVTCNDGSIELVLRTADFLVYDNMSQALYVTNFKKNEIDDTLPLKDVLCDQIQYVDYIQRDKKGKSLINKRFEGACKG